MKLRNKKTGEIVDVESIGHADSLKGKFGYQVTLSWKIDEHLCTCKTYNSLAALNDEWEDYKEPKESNSYWYIGYKNEIRTARTHSLSRFADNQITTTRKEIGNYFETREEAEKAVEKLKAWKRLKDKGFRFKYWYISDCQGEFSIVGEGKHLDTNDIQNDLELLFGGEE